MGMDVLGEMSEDETNENQMEIKVKDKVVDELLHFVPAC